MYNYRTLLLICFMFSLIALTPAVSAAPLMQFPPPDSFPPPDPYATPDPFPMNDNFYDCEPDDHWCDPSPGEVIIEFLVDLEELQGYCTEEIIVTCEDFSNYNGPELYDGAWTPNFHHDCDIYEVLDTIQNDECMAPYIDYVEPNFTLGIPEANPRGGWVWGTEGSAPLSTQYAVDMLNLPLAHQIGQGEGIVVAILDTGIQSQHPELADVLLPGYDFVDLDNDPEDVEKLLDSDLDGLFDEAWGHGTHVAGIVHQAAPLAQIMPLRVLDSEGAGDVVTIAEAIYYAVDNGADVINMSLGTDAESRYLNRVVQYALDEGVVVVAAAGNAESSDPQYPAAITGVIAVTSIDENGVKALGANYGEWVDVAAPGESIYSAVPIDGYAWWSGTSMASPFIAGEAALLVEQNVDPSQVEAAIQDTAITINATNPDYVDLLGTGQADIGATLLAQSDFSPTSVTVAQVTTSTSWTISLLFMVVGLVVLSALTRWLKI